MPVSPQDDGQLGDHQDNFDNFSVCLVQGRPTITVHSHNTSDKWLFDTGAGMSVISEDLYKRMTPRPKLSEANMRVTGANKKPVNLLGITTLPITVLDEQTTVEVLVSPELSYNAILGMDVIRKLNLVMNPRTLKFSKIKDVPVNAVSLQTYRVPALCGRPIKIKVIGPVADGNAVVSTPDCPSIDKLFVPEAMATVHDGIAIIMIKNCNTHEIVIPAKTTVCHIDFIDDSDTTINAATLEMPKDTPRPEPLGAKDQKAFINRIRMTVPDAYKSKYVSLFLKNHDIFSSNKADLGRANNFEHNIRLKSSLPIYRKQFRIPEAHQESLDKQIDEWVTMGIIEPCYSRYNSPIFIVPKKDGSFRFVLDYRALNENSLDDRYNMKDVGECIGEIGRAGSTIFSTMDLTSGFWQLPLERESRPLTAFTCPGKGQFCYNVLSMGLKGGPGSFQRMMELTMKEVQNVIVYIDDLLAHTATHDQHLHTLQLIFDKLRNVNLKLNPEKCEFGASSVQYLGFRLTPKGILPGKDKLQAVADMKPPTSVTEVRQFLGLCNYFRTHVRNFSTLAGPLNFLTSKKAGWRGGPLPPDAKASFNSLKQALTNEPIVAYPRNDRQFHLYVDAATGGANSSGGFGAILGQPDDKGRLQVIAYASRSLKQHEKNYTPYLAELNAAAWAIDNFDVYLRGRKFVLYTDHKPMVIKKSIHHKTLNRLEERMGMYDFDIVYKKGQFMPADVLSRKPMINAISTQDNSYRLAADADTFCQDVERYLVSGAVPSDPIRAKILHQIGPHLFKEGEILKLRSNEDDLIILPRSLANAAIDNAHGTLLTGHGGIDKTVARIRQLYYWPSIIVDVKQRLAECPRCQKALKTSPLGETLHPLPLCSEPNQRIHIDLFGPLKTTDGKAHVLCITDAFTRYAELCVVNNKEAVTIATAIITQWICRFGIPDQIMSDGGKEFCNKILSHICSILKIAKNKTTPAHPQCNAQVEIVNKTIKKYLATMTDNALDWEPLIPTLAFAYNTTVHSTTGYSPAHLMFGYQPKFLTNESLPDGHSVQTDNLLRHLFLNRQVATKNALQNTNKYKERHDKNVEETILSPGQFVFLDRRMFLNTNEKIEDKWEGPYLISKVFPNGTLDLIRKGRSIRVNKQRVKPFTALGQVKSFIPDMPPQLTDDATLDNDISSDPPVASYSPPSTPHPSPTKTFSNFPPSPDHKSPVAAPARKRGRPRKTPSTFVTPNPSADTNNSNDTNITSEANPPLPNTDNAGQIVNNPRFGSHPMVLRQRVSNPTVSHLKIAALATHENIPKVKRLNAIFIRKFAKLVNRLAEINVLDEYALPKQVTNQSTKKQVDRRRQYLKSLSPAQRNTLLTGDPLFSFDPVTYEYVWSSYRDPLPPDLAQYFEHLPDVPGYPGGHLVPLPPPPSRPASAPLFPHVAPYDPVRDASTAQHGAISRPQRLWTPQPIPPSIPLPIYYDPPAYLPSSNIPFPVQYLPAEFQPYQPPVIPPIPIQQPPLPMSPSYYPPSSFITHRSPPVNNPPHFPPAPRRSRSYQNPFLEWPPARHSSIQPQPAQGTFERLRISDNVPYSHPSHHPMSRSNSVPTQPSSIPMDTSPIHQHELDYYQAPALSYHPPQPVFQFPMPQGQHPIVPQPALPTTHHVPIGPPPIPPFSTQSSYPTPQGFPHFSSSSSSSQSSASAASYLFPDHSRSLSIPQQPAISAPPIHPALPQPPVQQALPSPPAILPLPAPAVQRALPAPQTFPAIPQPPTVQALPSPPTPLALPPPANPEPSRPSPPSTPPLDESLTARLKQALKRFPVRKYKLPPHHPAHQLPLFRGAAPSSSNHRITTQAFVPTSHQLALPLPDDDSPMPLTRTRSLPYRIRTANPPSASISTNPIPLPYHPSPMDTTSTAQANIHRSMSQGTRSSSNTSMPSQADPMDDARIQPFSALPGPQFQDLAHSVKFIPPQTVPPLYSFSGYRESSAQEPVYFPSAPRRNTSYEQPFLEWPPARNEYNLPRPSQGTFERLRISDGNLTINQALQPSAPQLPHPYPPATPAPAIVHAPPRPPPPQLHYQQQQPTYEVVHVPREHRRAPTLARDPSIDAVQINTLHAELPRLVPSELPPKLTRLEKVLAFFGNDCLMQRQWHRRWLRRHYKRFYS